MDGWEATRQIRKWELESCNLCRDSSEEFCPHRRLPVVAVTADVVVKTRSMCFSSGMDDYITKVFLADFTIQCWYTMYFCLSTSCGTPVIYSLPLVDSFTNLALVDFVLLGFT